MASVDGHVQATTFVPGTYEGESAGKDGGVKVAVTVEEHAITDIQIVDQNESADYAATALKFLPMKIVATQNLKVDAVSGATMISKGIVTAVGRALKQAGGNASVLEPCEDGLDVEQHMVPGSYEAEALGYWPPESVEGARLGADPNPQPIKVRVTVDETSIKSVEVLTCTDTVNFKKPVLERIPSSIVEQQSIFVDTVTGATGTCAGVLRATAKALEQAGADMRGFLKSKPRVDDEVDVVCDVCIVGGGHAGTTAAVAAVEAGADVVVLERAGRIGGRGFCSSGISAAESRVENEAGCTATVDDFYRSLMQQSGGRANSLLVREITGQSGKVLDWLCDHGFTVKAPDPNATWDDAFMCSTGKGQDKFDHLYDEHVLKNGGRVMLETRATELVMDNGRVVGVEAQQQDGTRVHVKCKAVILATGGFGGSPELLRRFCFSDAFYDRGLTTMCSGDGILMCEKVGAQLGPEIMPHMQEFGANPECNFTANLIKYITYAGFLAVNSEGKRFMDESLNISDAMGAGCASLRVQGTYYLIIDQQQVDALQEGGIGGYYDGKLQSYFDMAVFDRAMVPLVTLQKNLDEAIALGQAWKADSPEELAHKVGFADPDVFVATLARYNEQCTQGRDDDFGKIPQLLNAHVPPLYAVRMVIPIMGTLGGVKVNERLEVLDKCDNPIPGLYMCGQETSGFYSYPYYATKCSTSTYAYGSGKLSGEHAAAYAAQQ